MKSVFNYILIFLAISIFLASFKSSQAASLKATYPRLANYYLKWELSESEARDLAKWDLLILDMEVQENSPESLKLIRELNPNVIILAYITSQEIIDDVQKTAGYTGAHLRTMLRNEISDNWWLRDGSDSRISYWPGTYLLNLSNQSKTNHSGERFNDFLPRFVNSYIVNSNLFDGVFYDNSWGDVTWVKEDIDINRDGKVEDISLVNEAWADGYLDMLEKSREIFPKDFIIVGNGRVHWDYQNKLNGMMLESFPSEWENGGSWLGSMQSYFNLNSNNLNPKLSVINVNTKSEVDYKSMRFGLSSALLGEGYFSYDYDTTNHTQTWWYDEYDVNLGPAQSLAYNLLSSSNNLANGLWRRDFKEGSVLLNSTDRNQVYILDKEEMEKIKGSQDYKINNGEKVSYVKIAPNDGLVLLKSSQNIYNDAFRNGYFYRVFDDKGSQIRNGFFAYSSAYNAEATVVVANGSRSDLEDVSVIADKGKVRLNKNGKEIASFYPYNNLFRSSLNIDTKLNDGFFETVAVGTSQGGGPQVRIFSATGQLTSSFFAYDKNLRGGVSVALGDINSDGSLELITGAGYGDEPVVKIFSLNGKLLNSFYAYDKNFRGGVEVAVGDINNNGYNEIICAPGPGGGPQIRIFNSSGRVIGQFFAYDNSIRSGLKLSLSDINNDGKIEILAGVKNLF